VAEVLTEVGAEEVEDSEAVAEVVVVGDMGVDEGEEVGVDAMEGKLLFS